jgi:diguanylate cyclase (GGDEF)-like protein
MLAATLAKETPVAPRVVFVDDDTNLLESLRDRLRRMQGCWDMRFYDNAAAAMADLEQASKGQPAVLVSDWMMPGTDGLSLCRRLAVESRDEPSDQSRCYMILLTGNQGIENVVTALEAGADDFISKPVDARELIARIRVGVRVCRLEQRLREANCHLAELATTDVLTGLMNRRRAVEVLEGELERCWRGAQTLGVAMIDIDHFKRVNDTWGHEAGDLVLKEVGQRLQRACRNYDSVVRWGGEEFLVICPQAAQDEISIVAERMRETVGEKPIIAAPDTPHSITVSIGTTSVPAGRRSTPTVAIAQADRALYDAKRAGRDRVRWGGFPSTGAHETIMRPGGRIRGEVLIEE